MENFKLAYSVVLTTGEDEDHTVSSKLVSCLPEAEGTSYATAGGDVKGNPVRVVKLRNQLTTKDTKVHEGNRRSCPRGFRKHVPRSGRVRD